MEQLKPSLLGLGMMRLPCTDEGDGCIDTAKAKEMVDYALKNGVNYFDTAYPYHKGTSELFVGEALQGYPRESFLLADKLPAWELKELGDPCRIFEEQLEKCRVEYFDYYLCHSVTAETIQRFEEFDAIEYLKNRRRAGRIRKLGFSFHDTPEVLERILSLCDWDFVLIQLNYLDWELQDAKGQYEVLRKHNIPIMIMEPVRGGALATLCNEAAASLKEADSQASLASWALRFAATLPGVLTVLSGMSSLEQLHENTKTFCSLKPLTEGERTMLIEAGRTHRKAVTVPCTACRYCMDCPSGVDIPNVFLCYNNYALSKSQFELSTGYNELAEKKRAHCCTACGKCTPHCPQGIKIPQQMAAIAAELAPLLK